MIKKFCALLVFPVLMAGLWAGPAAAKIELVVSTTRAEHQVAPGGSETDVVQVTNEGAKPLRVRVFMEDWSLNPKGEVVFARAGSAPHSLTGWLQANPMDFQLEAGQSRQVRYTLTVPPSVRNQSYWGAMIFEGTPIVSGQASPRLMVLRGRIAVMIYQKTGNPEVRARLQDFQVETQKKKAFFTLTMVNSGQAHYRVKGHISIQNAQKQEVSKIDLSDFPVLPSSTRQTKVERNLDLGKGTYEAVLVLDVGRRELLGSRKSFTLP